MANNEPIGVDATGYEVLTKAASELLNSYPGISLFGDWIPFEELSEYGIAFSAKSGALIMNEKRDITDYVKQSCQFPFFIVCRVSSSNASQKIRVQTFLDSLGKWLCKEPIAEEYEPAEYPELAGGRKITRITRENSYGLDPAPDGTQEWLMPVTIEYKNEFQLW